MIDESEIKLGPGLRPRVGMSAMAMTGLMVGGVSEPEMMQARGLAPGGSKPQAHNKRSKAERDQRRKVKAARRKNRRG